MKKYVKPVMASEMFVTNEYVAACWYGECNISGRVYLDSNNNGQYDEGTDKYSYNNSACTHTFSIQGIDNGIENASQLQNAFVVGEQLKWVKDDSFWGGHFETITTVTPVYNFDQVHVSTIDSIRKAEDRPNHS